MKNNYIQTYKKAHPRVLALINDKLSNGFSEHDYKLVLSNSNTKYWKGLNPTSWNETFSTNEPTLGQIIKYEGLERAKLICIHIFSDQEILNSSDQELIISYLLSDDGYRSFTILDLKHCLHLGRLGQLTKSFGDLKISDITGLDGWFETYFQLRIKEDEVYRLKKSQKVVEPEINLDKVVPAPKEYLEKVKELEDKLRNERIAKSRSYATKYTTIESYVNESEKNAIEAKELESKWIKEHSKTKSGIKIKQYIGIKWEQFLYAKRKGIKQ